MLTEYTITYNDKLDDFYTEDKDEAQEEFKENKKDIRQFFQKDYIEINGEMIEDNCIIIYENLK